MAASNLGEKMSAMTKLVAVAIDKDRASQFALKWALDNILARGQTVILVHVRLRQSSAGGLSTSPSSFSSCNNISPFYVSLVFEIRNSALLQQYIFHVPNKKTIKIILSVYLNDERAYLRNFNQFYLHASLC